MSVSTLLENYLAVVVGVSDLRLSTTHLVKIWIPSAMFITRLPPYWSVMAESSATLVSILVGFVSCKHPLLS